MLGDGCSLVAVDVYAPIGALVLRELCASGELPFLVQLLKGVHDPLLKDSLAGVVAENASDVAQLQLGDLLSFGCVRASRERLQRNRQNDKIILPLMFKNFLGVYLCTTYTIAC